MALQLLMALLPLSRLDLIRYIIKDKLGKIYKKIMLHHEGEFDFCP